MRAILGGMLQIAATHELAAVTDVDRASIAAAHRYMFRQLDWLDLASLPPCAPAELGAVLRGGALADHAVGFLTVMAFVDGVLDTAKIATVLSYAKALGIEADYLTEIAEIAAGHVRWVLADMTRKNMESLAGAPWATNDVLAWILPYDGDGADPALAARFEALEALPEGSLGRAYWEFYRAEGYALPGHERAINEIFAAPHDTTHILSGYDTSSRGEILVSTFTAAMHKSHAMAGHVLPVIFSWHLGAQINDAARPAIDALDPEDFWRALARGALCDVDVFDPAWKIWDWTSESVADLRARHLREP